MKYLCYKYNLLVVLVAYYGHYSISLPRSWLQGDRPMRYIFSCVFSSLITEHHPLHFGGSVLTFMT